MVIPVRNPERMLGLPVCRLLTWRKTVPVSAWWQPLQVLSAIRCRASLLPIPGAFQGAKVGAAPANMSAGTEKVPARIAASLSLISEASSEVPFRVLKSGVSLTVVCSSRPVSGVSTNSRISQGPARAISLVRIWLIALPFGLLGAELGPVKRLVMRSRRWL